MEPATPTRQRLDLEKLPRKHKKLDVPPKVGYYHFTVSCNSETAIFC
jgi:hypothetical protein